MGTDFRVNPTSGLSLMRAFILEGSGTCSAINKPESKNNCEQ